LIFPLFERSACMHGATLSPFSGLGGARLLSCWAYVFASLNHFRPLVLVTQEVGEFFCPPLFFDLPRCQDPLPAWFYRAGQHIPLFFFFFDGPDFNCPRNFSLEALPPVEVKIKLMISFPPLIINTPLVASFLWPAIETLGSTPSARDSRWRTPPPSVHS